MAGFKPLVLMYHAVSDGWNDPLSVRVADFERQLARLVGSGRRGVSAAEALARPGDRRLFHVTFDDAYTSVQNALPALRRHGVPCTVFVCTDYARDGRPLRIPELADRGDDEVLATLDWAALRTLVATGLVEVGSHGLGHVDLTRLSDEELERELAASKQAVEEQLGRLCTTAAYPFGRQDARVREAAARAGYDAAFAIAGSAGRHDPYQVSRTGIWRDEPPFRQRVRTSYPVRQLLARRNAGR